MIRAQGDIPRIGTKPNISQEELNNIAQEKQRRDLRDKMVEDKRIREFERMLHMSHHDDRLTDYMEQVRAAIDTIDSVLIYDYEFLCYLCSTDRNFLEMNNEILNKATVLRYQ